MAFFVFLRTSFFTLIIIVSCTLISILFRAFLTEGDVAMIYLLGVVIVSSRCSWGHSIFAVMMSVALTNLLFVPPFYTFDVESVRSFTTFVVMFLVGSLVTWLSMNLRRKVEEIRMKEKERSLFLMQNEENRVKSEKEKMKNDLLSAIAHDLKTPLSSIAGNATVLLQDTSKINDTKKVEMLKTISKEAFRLNRLVENILSITKLESSDFNVKKDWYPLEEIISSSITRVEKMYIDRKLEVNFPDKMVMLLIDPVLIEQVLINLLENAAKYSPVDSPVKIEVVLEDSSVTVSIIDKGKGVPESKLSKIFDKFYRLHDGGANMDSSGIGLSVCRTIIKVHEGDIKAENFQSGGFMVSFTLPVSEKFVEDKEIDLEV